MLKIPIFPNQIHDDVNTAITQNMHGTFIKCNCQK